MPLDITFTLSDRDLERFKKIINGSRFDSCDQHNQEEIEKATRKLVELAMNADLPDFIASRLLQLKILLQMMQDQEWGLEDHEKARINSALSYFVDPADLIPDHIPGIGFLDDAIFVEIVIRELQEDISIYTEFCEFRDAEEARLLAAGKDSQLNRADWLAVKRDELQSRLRDLRAQHGDNGFALHFL